MVDGRTLRREDNREAVLDALLALYREGVYRPSSNEIAERAGLSPRSLFRYFDDVDDLTRAAIERQLATARPLLDVNIEPDASIAERIERLVAARVHLYEAIAPAARAARLGAPHQPLIAAQLRQARSFLRHQLALLFAAELQGERAALLPALDALCSFEAYELLRADQGLSSEAVASSLVAALTVVLAAPADG